MNNVNFNNLTFCDYQEQSYKNIKPHKDWRDMICDYSIGLCEEVGEVMNHIKHLFWSKENIDKDKLKKEFGDVLWYLSALVTEFECDLGEVAKLNIEKLNARYKNGFSFESSQNRHSNENIKMLYLFDDDKNIK